MPQPRQPWRVPLLWLGFATAIGLLLTGYRYLDDVSRGHAPPLAVPLTEELTGAYTAILLFALMVPLLRRFPLTGATWRRRLPAYLALMLAFSASHTTLMWGTRSAIFPLLGLGPYDYGRMPVRYLMELGNDVIVFWLVVSLVHLFDHWRATRARELRSAQLETRLAEARLQNLRLQLQPHFLFNALNTVSSVMYDDPQSADTMLARLADLLRLSLRRDGAQEVTLAEELEFLQLYVDVMRTRFEDRLDVRTTVEPDLGSALVPSLLLQPLVENAIRHGESQGRARVEVAVRRDADELVLQVRDHGPGISAGREEILGRGVGLSATVERLAQLYGRRQRLGWAAAPGGGLLLSIVIPFRVAERAAVHA